MSDNQPVYRATASSGGSNTSPSKSSSNASDDATLTLQGLGALGVQLGRPAPQETVTGPQPMRPTATNVGGFQRMTFGSEGATMETGDSVARATQGRPGEGSNSIIATIRSPLGNPRSGADVRPSDLITVAGMETTVAAAQAAGFIVKDAQGNWYEAGKAPASSQQQQPQEQREQQEQQDQPKPAGETVAALDETSEAIMDNLVSNVGNMELSQGLETILAGEELPADLLARTGSTLGIEAEQVKEQVAQVITAFETQARSAVGDPVIEWAKTARLDALRGAAREQAMSGSLKGYAALATEYIARLPSIDPDRIMNSPDAKAAGVQRDSNGVITIYHPNAGRVPWAAAVKAGLIGPKFGKRQ